MAAAIATLDELVATDAPAHMHRMGLRLRDGFAQQAAKYGLVLRQSGPPQMPTVLFENDVDWAKGARFCTEAVQRGVFLHHRHNMFLSTAHTEATIDEALSITDEAFAAVANAF